MNVAILGVGRLGLPMAALYASAGHKVIGIDLRDDLIEQLRAGTFRTDEPEVNDLLKQNADRLTFDRLPYEALLKAEIVFVVVPTPSKADGTFSSEYVVKACQQIGVALHDKDAFTLVVVVSTLMPGQMDADVVPALQRASGKRAGVEFGVCYSPEFIALGRVIAGLRNPDYVLIGNNNWHDAVMARSFYLTYIRKEPPVDHFFHEMSFVNAELAKLATNAYLSLKIAYANVLGQICEQLPGANVDVVTQAVGSDHRIGGAYLRAGLPPSGPCLPRDLEAIGTYDGAGFLTSLPTQNKNYFDDILHALKVQLIYGVDHIVVLGTAYSPSTALETFSWGYALEHALKDDGYDVDFCVLDDDAQALVDQSSVVIIALPMESYKRLQFNNGQAIFDLWRVFDECPPGAERLRRLGVGAKVGEHV